MTFPSPIAKSCALYCLQLLIHNTAVSHGVYAGVILGQDTGVAADGMLFTPIRMSFRQLIERLLIQTRMDGKNVLLPLNIEVLQFKVQILRSVIPVVYIRTTVDQ